MNDKNEIPDRMKWPETPSDGLEEVRARLDYAIGTMMALTADPDIEDWITDAIGGAEHHLRDAKAMTGILCPLVYARRQLATDAADNILRIEGEAPAEPDGQEALGALSELSQQKEQVQLLLDNFPDHEWHKGGAVNGAVVGRLYAAGALMSRIHTLVEEASDMQAESEGDPKTVFTATRENIDAIRRQAEGLKDGELRETVNELADQLEHDLQPSKGAFEEENYTLLRGIIHGARCLYREVNEPNEGYDINRPAVEASCALDALVDQLEQALGDEL